MSFAEIVNQKVFVNGEWKPFIKFAPADTTAIVEAVEKADKGLIPRAQVYKDFPGYFEVEAAWNNMANESNAANRGRPSFGRYLH